MRNPLLLPELLHHILDCLEEPDLLEPRTVCSTAGIRIHEPSRTSRKAFFALALTCRALSELSLDRLWRVLDSVIPLIRCFTEVVDEERAKVNG